MLKPDLVAPSNLRLAAAGTGTAVYRGVTGTSFAAPLVSGALALLKQKCPTCSPFALKALLMNQAHRSVRYEDGSRLGAPVSSMGAGEMDVEPRQPVDRPRDGQPGLATHVWQRNCSDS